MTLPREFEEYTSALMGKELYEVLKQGLSQEPTVSIRLNPYKSSYTPATTNAVAGCEGEGTTERHAVPVPWCHNGLYLDERPNFTFDPLLHAGAYYVQEASSMFLDFALRQLVNNPVTMLDLCAAPGGKSTCARAALPDGSLLFANEPLRTRANILAENIMKFGHPDVVVTNNYPKDYKKTGLKFDVILADVPCSGEGMFRKDPNAISEWSPANVEKCQRLQRTIIDDIWQCLKPGGLLIYSTCTFNAKEDEENVQWIADNMGAEPVTLQGVESDWHITGALSGSLPVYRFIPGKTRGEGLFMAVLRKDGNTGTASSRLPATTELDRKAKASLNILSHGINPPAKKGKKEIPDVSLALTIMQQANKYPRVEVDRPTAIQYLRRESLTLPPDTPRGIVTITYKRLGLGFANNLGNRANNLYPQEWRIKSTHVPNVER